MHWVQPFSYVYLIENKILSIRYFLVLICGLSLVLASARGLNLDHLQGVSPM